ncbi:MAG TPA: hypothetical protein VHD87_15025 [Acidimicrobiales bacterium]|nr:hypothetical protein [Acidimicrobiales bacterium]
MSRALLDAATSIAQEHAERLRWCAAGDAWLLFDGIRLNPNTTAVHHLVVQRLAADDADMTAQAITEVCDLLKLQPGVQVDPDELDADPWRLATPAGILDIRDGQLEQATPSALITRALAAAPGADDADIFAELVEITIPNPAHRELFRSLCGLSLVAAGTVPTVRAAVTGAAARRLLRPLQTALGDYAKPRWPTGSRARATFDGPPPSNAAVAWLTASSTRGGFSIDATGTDRALTLSDAAVAAPQGVIAYAAAAARDWYDAGGPPIGPAGPPNSYDGFASEHLVADAQGWCWASELYAAYTKWAEDAGLEVFTQRRFADHLTAAGYRNRMRGKQRRIAWYGVTLVEADKP